MYVVIVSGIQCGDLCANDVDPMQSIDWSSDLSNYTPQVAVFVPSANTVLIDLVCVQIGPPANVAGC